MPRPPKHESAKVRKANMTLAPLVLDALSDLMKQDGEDNRSRMVSLLIVAEQKRRQHAKERSRKRAADAKRPVRR